MDESMVRWMDGWMDGWMDVWMDGCMDGWMDGYLASQLQIRYPRNRRHRLVIGEHHIFGGTSLIPPRLQFLLDPDPKQKKKHHHESYPSSTKKNVNLQLNQHSKVKSVQCKI